MIDKETVQRIKDAADIVEVVSDYVHLTRRGSNYMGLCPFHNERTPSFSVNRRRNFCYCFSCHKGGSPVNFIMEKEGISYHDALIQLANKYGIEVHERELSDTERREQNERDAMFTANRWAMEIMENNLTNTQEGRDVGLQYFYQRGLTDEAIRAFHLGYALDRGDALTTEARKAGYDPEVLFSTGLLGHSRDGGHYDRFRGRVIFPVFTPSGKVVAFGGRTLKGDKAKYINSPESSIYTKSNELYGLYQAKSDMVRLDRCFLVEGYMDVISMWQAGLKNVVASSGTALTDGQIALIHRFTSNVTLLYDGDNAGIHAALRGIDMLLSHKMNVNVLLLPDGHDPDSFARSHTPEEFENYVKEHETDIIRFKARVLMEESADNPQRRAEAIRSIVTSLACIADPITRNVYINECSALMDVNANMLASEIVKAREKAVYEQRRAREYERTRENTPTRQVSPAQDPGQQPQGASSAPSGTPASAPSAPVPPARETRLQMRLRQCEEEVLRYCVRYGMVYFCDSVDENGAETPMNLCSYVRHELAEDGMSFTFPVYHRLFLEIEALTEPFARALDEHIAAEEPRFARMLEEKYAEIAERQLSMDDVKALEHKAEEEIQNERNREIFDFTTIWPGQQLASHEDDELRAEATRLLTARYHLSNVYRRHGAHVAEESERLGELVPRAIDEWKDTILQQRLADLREQLAEAVAAGDADKARQLQQQTAEILALRSLVAKNIGDRVISAR